ncbi:MAG TPA: hypothetical protein VN776_16360, partial [Terracidiphilus sp.]|nr:hypothetical protein [Terracidiphilus sp.]
MKKLLSLIGLLAVAFVCSAQAPAPSVPGEFLLHAGVSTDFVSHQPSALTGFSYQVATIGGMPTYWSTTFETALIKTPNVSNSITLATGFLQIPYHQNHWGLYYYS